MQSKCIMSSIGPYQETRFLPSHYSFVGKTFIQQLTSFPTCTGAYVVQAFAKKLDELLHQPPDYGSGRECDCVLLLLAHLYNYKVREMFSVVSSLFCRTNGVHYGYNGNSWEPECELV